MSFPITLNQLREIHRLSAEMFSLLTDERGPQIDPKSVLAALQAVCLGRSFPDATADADPGKILKLADVVDIAESKAITQALKATDGDRDRAARLLGIAQTTLWRKMERFGITHR